MDEQTAAVIAAAWNYLRWHEYVDPRVATMSQVIEAVHEVAHLDDRQGGATIVWLWHREATRNLSLYRQFADWWLVLMPLHQSSSYVVLWPSVVLSEMMALR